MRRLSVRNASNTPEPIAELNDPESFGVLGEKYFADLSVLNHSPNTIIGKRSRLKQFAHWCLNHAIEKPDMLTQEYAERYQRYVHQSRKANGKPLSVGAQRHHMTDVKMFYRWLVKQNYLLYSPLENIELPKMPKALPKSVLSEKEIEHLMSQPDITRPAGLRDRAMMEVFYSTGIRRSELLALKLHDVDRHRGLMRVTKGKGQKDRIVPIGDRALHWLQRYLQDSRPHLVVAASEPTLFISKYGTKIGRTTITQRFTEYRQAAGIQKPGSVHIFRHTTATVMLDHGADIRHIQALLGHEDLSTTQIYTQVAITQLKAVHNQTHPAKLASKDE